MIEKNFLTRVQQLSDDALHSQVTNAYNIAYGETFGDDHEAHADAIQTYEALELEWRRRVAQRLAAAGL